ncbi:3-hydroxyacyl-CoA dehydrogenase [Lipomyces oligophaga]|uniref:3-hydroxyacyl-CoA dehydrogenase n=1 Tax=Lipomyces oligophaga TaxID=45792 RepID=UPI0034CEF0B0
MKMISPVVTTRPRMIRTLNHLCFRGFQTSAAGRHQVERLGVIGAGQMGFGIAYVAAMRARVPVLLIDNSAESLAKAGKFLKKLSEKDVAKGKMTGEQAEELRGMIEMTDEFSRVGQCDFVIEAVPEIASLKQQIFAELAMSTAADATLATNTSSISITKIAAAAKGREDRVVATHFMNPVPVQRGVEIIRGLQTSDATVERAEALVKAMGKLASVSEDRAGFLANRVLIPYINEAILCLENGTGTRDGIDSIMVNGCAMPMGPLALADFIGLDTCLSIMNVLFEETQDSKYRASALLRRMVEAGWLGKKTGRGFYDYSS